MCFCPGLPVADDPEHTGDVEYVFTLPDGIPSRFRYVLLAGYPTMHFRVPNRSILENPDFNLRSCATRVARAFDKPHQTLELEPEAEAAYLGYQTLLNIQSNAAVQAPCMRCLLEAAFLVHFCFVLQKEQSHSIQARNVSVLRLTVTSSPRG